MRSVLLAVLVVATSAGLTLERWREQGKSPVQRGLELARRQGCLGCHATSGAPDVEPAGGVGVVPSFSAEDVRRHARDADDLRDWILEGRPLRIPNQARPAALLRMPAYEERLDDADLEHLVAWLSAVAGFDTPGDALAKEGRQQAIRLGCFACHGPQGRGGLENPGSLLGYVPGLSGTGLGGQALEAPELREWILDGSSRRSREGAVSSFFLRRARVQMPGYREHVAPEQLDALLAYITWLGAPAAASRTAGAAGDPGAGG